MLAFLFCASFSYSQLRLAIVGGGHTATVNETNDLPNWNDIKNKYSARPGAHFGFIADLQLGAKSKFYFQPGIVYHNKGRKFANNYDTAVFNYFSINKKQFINYVDAPLNLVYKTSISGKTKFFIGGGPYLSFFYNGFEKTETYLKSGSVTTLENNDLPVGDAPGKYKTMDYGVNAVAGIEFSKIFLSVNFSRGLSDFYQANYTGSFKHQVVGATLGIFLGKPVEIEPKITDRDQDGIPDLEDDCVDVPGLLITKGCPDTDGDGIADKDDQCPTEKGLLANKGCPVRDRDGDGIKDDVDKCIDVPGVLKYQGCPVPDTDKDGVNDDDDKCKDTPGLARLEGCPVLDTDGDGVNDEEDKCVTVFGKKENQGCPDITKEVIEKVEYAAKRIQFTYAKAVLRKESEPVLDEVAALLTKDNSLKLDIEGHTSNEGNLNANMKLSSERADIVMKYLINKGIDASRLTAQGFGPTRPLNNGKTEAERALNRRVELKLRAD